MSYSNAFNVRKQLRHSPYTPMYAFVPTPTLEELPPAPTLDKFGQPDEIMVEKQKIVEERGEVKRGKIVQPKKGKKKRLPGEKLMKKIAREQQFEKIMSKVVREMVI